MEEELNTEEFKLLRSIATEKLYHQPFVYEKEDDGKTK